MKTRVNFTSNEHTTSYKDENGRWWPKVFRYLLDCSELTYYDDKFYQWLLEEYGILCLHEHAVYPSHLTGLEMDDSTYTVLLLLTTEDV